MMPSDTENGWSVPADKIRAAAEAAYAKARSNGDLMPAAIQRQIAQTYIAAKTQMDELAAKDGQQTAANLAAAQRAAYGIEDVTSKMSPAEVTQAMASFRDAQDRVAAILEANDAPAGSAKLRALLARAEASGDELLARAVGNAALQELGDPALVDAYLSRRPAKAAAFEKVKAASAAAGVAASPLTIVHPSTQSLFNFILSKPSELVGLGDYQINALATAS
jgi:hypothetical protein